MKGGTNSRFDWSTGATLPLVARPWGFNHWSPQSVSNYDFGFWFHPYDKRFFGMRCTHQPSPWMEDYGQFRIFPSIPGQYQTLKDQAAAYDVSKSTWKPYYFNASLIGYGTASSGDTTVEFTSTSHASIMRVKFPTYFSSIYDSAFSQSRRVEIILEGGDDSRGYDFAEVKSMPDDGTLSIQGYSKANVGGVPSNFAHYFVAAIYTGTDGNVPSVKYLNTSSSNEGAFIDFDPIDPSNDLIVVRIATSLISIEQAIVNLRREAPTSKTFTELVQESKYEWNSVLSRVSVDEIHPDYTQQQQDDLKVTFYSSLYRASLFPRYSSETNAVGEELHWSAYDPNGSVFMGPASTDSGFWDAFSTVCEYSVINTYFVCCGTLYFSRYIVLLPYCFPIMRCLS
jgi:putative alpha-1,2-mannosidase